MDRRTWVSFVLVATAACSEPVPRPRYVYRVVRVRDAAQGCDPSQGSARSTIAPAYLAVRDDVINYRVFACETLEDCARAMDGAVREGAAAWSATVPAFVFTPRTSAASGPCEGVASTWRSGPVGEGALQLDVITQTLEGLPREVSGACAVEVAESRAASTPCDIATRYEGERVNVP